MARRKPTSRLAERLFADNQKDLFEKSYEEKLIEDKNKPVECLGITFPNDEERRIYFLQKLRDEARNLTPEWGPQCGVHDRLPDRRDTGDRAQLRAEIDAYVAHLYGLSRDDFAYILDTFSVLRKKEEKAFGEFMSKRKCLEEYDRIKTIMNDEG